ncbi:50S ribosomal protein L25/general stress protein Ctc [Sediminicola luteus]|uniref:Large ribosomal subunit protein bL25 n=1 Tax=Sediminicola luteus TaxID=319238 RepID=A0A2A4GCH9_9FLAO|nr:50S ribosomal protein L25/general stress protein Ctc [Sediminicola luteus]PCE66121.1 50S ribosomal protein L25/general stress protein Ctc [Sediminicola luteus]
MKSITIKGSVRESVGKKATKALRNAEMVPCVLYGGEKPMHFSAPELAFKSLVYTPNAHTVVVDLDNGEKINAVLQDIQFHPVTDRILHIDFYQLFDDKAVTMDIPVILEGNSPGVMNGGNMIFRKRKLSVKALPGQLPDNIKVDISELKIGGKVYVADVKSEDYTFLHPDNTVIVQVKTSRNAVAQTDEEEEETEAAAE